MRDTIASPDRAVRKSIRLAEVWEALLFTIGSYQDFASDMQGGLVSHEVADGRSNFATITM
jgi:hypothetical protein